MNDPVSIGATRQSPADRPIRHKGIYINLDGSEERRRELESQLQKFGLAQHYVRFPAVEGASVTPRQTELQPGEIACFQSHYLALEHLCVQQTCVHVMEDDVLLSEYIPEVIESLRSAGATDRFDIIFTEMAISTDALQVALYKREFDRSFPTRVLEKGRPKFRVLDISSSYTCGMTSYLVSPGATLRVLNALKRGLDSGPRRPIDIHIKNEALKGNLRLGCVFPFITSVRLEHITTTTIAGRGGGPRPFSTQIEALLRYLFFVNYDLSHYAKPWMDEMKRAKAKRTQNEHQDAIVQVLEFLSSPNGDDPSSTKDRAERSVEGIVPS